MNDRRWLLVACFVGLLACLLSHQPSIPSLLFGIPCPSNSQGSKGLDDLTRRQHTAGAGIRHGTRATMNGVKAFVVDWYMLVPSFSDRTVSSHAASTSHY